MNDMSIDMIGLSIVGRGSFGVESWIRDNRRELVSKGYKITKGFLHTSISPASHIVKLRHVITGEKNENGVTDTREIDREWVIDYHEIELKYRKWESEGMNYRKNVPKEGYQYEK